jgi:hypothetical protein
VVRREDRIRGGPTAAGLAIKRGEHHARPPWCASAVRLMVAGTTAEA